MKSQISESTQVQYKSRLSKVKKSICDDLLEVAQHFDKIDALYPNIQTRKGCLSAIIWKLRDMEKTDTAATAVIAAVLTRFNSLRKECIEQTNKQELTENQLKNYMPYPDLVALLNKALSEVNIGMNLTEYNDRHVDLAILYLYVVQPPVRADYWDMYYIDYNPDDDIIETGKYFTLEEKIKLQIVKHASDNRNNFCLMTPTETYFIFNTYKTSDTYGQRVIKAEFAVHHYLDYCHHTLRMNTVLPAIKTPNSLVKEVKQAFLQFGGKPVTIGLLRHAYITEIYKRNPTIQQKTDLAYRMLHSKSIQETYSSHNVTDDEI